MPRISEVDCPEHEQAVARDVPRIAVVTWAVVAALLLGVASAFDLVLSERIADRSSSWALWFQRYGEVPGYVLGGVGALILLLALTSPPHLDQPGSSCTGRIATACICFCTLCFVLGGVMFQVFGVDKVVAGGVAFVAVGVSCAATGGGLKVDQKRLLHRRLAPWRPLGLSLMLLAIFGEMLLTLTKLCWGRARPYMVLPAACLERDAACTVDWPPDEHCDNYIMNHTYPERQQFHCSFSGWWHPNGYRAGLFSFPSGHTFSGWMPLPIALHWTELPLWTEHESSPATLTVFVHAVVVLWGVCVGASRVCVGAHWLSDTVVASIASWAFAGYLWKKHPPVAATSLYIGTTQTTGTTSEAVVGDDFTVRV